jgi:hypothetical protein
LLVYNTKNNFFSPYEGQKVQSLHYKYSVKKHNSILSLKTDNSVFVYLNKKLREPLNNTGHKNLPFLLFVKICLL